MHRQYLGEYASSYYQDSVLRDTWAGMVNAYNVMLTANYYFSNTLCISIFGPLPNRDLIGVAALFDLDTQS